MHFVANEARSLIDEMSSMTESILEVDFVSFGNWNPIGAFAAALLFGFADALQVKMQILQPVLPFMEQPIPPEFLQMVPYILTIIVVAGVVGRARPPAAEGKPYEKQ